MAMLTWHRNITHSLVLLPVWAVLLALLTVALARLIALAGPAVSHAGADLCCGPGQPRLPGFDYLLRHDDLEPAGLFAAGAGLAVYC